MNQRPSEEEYAGSSGEYIRLVPDGNIIDILLAQEKQMTELLASLTESQAAYRYAEGKWTLKEVVGHITDAERVMTYRLLRFARGDQTPLTGFDQELFMPPLEAGQSRNWPKTTRPSGNQRSHCCAGYRLRRGIVRVQPTT